jgi:hypothetical protein
MCAARYFKSASPVRCLLFAPDGTRTLFGATPDPSQIFDVAFDNGGNLFVAGAVAATIHKFSPTESSFSPPVWIAQNF